MRSYDKGLNNALTLIKKIYKNVWHTKERATDKKKVEQNHLTRRYAISSIY